MSGRVDQIQQYAGFTLTLFASLAVSCVIVLRRRRPDLARPFRTWGYPATPLFFLAVSAWMMVWAFRGRPVESTLSLLTVAAGGVAFLLLVARRRDGVGGRSLQNSAICGPEAGGRNDAAESSKCAGHEAGPSHRDREQRRDLLGVLSGAAPAHAELGVVELAVARVAHAREHALGALGAMLRSHARRRP